MAPIAARPIKSGDIRYDETQQGASLWTDPNTYAKDSPLVLFVLSPSFASFKSLACQPKETPTSTDEIIMKITTECSGILGSEWERVTS